MTITSERPITGARHAEPIRLRLFIYSVKTGRFANWHYSPIDVGELDDASLEDLKELYDWDGVVSTVRRYQESPDGITLINHEDVIMQRVMVDGLLDWYRFDDPIAIAARAGA